jgi:hypothetical protein
MAICSEIGRAMASLTSLLYYICVSSICVSSIYISILLIDASSLRSKSDVIHVKYSRYFSLSSPLSSDTYV